MDTVVVYYQLRLLLYPVTGRNLHTTLPSRSRSHWVSDAMEI